MMKILTVKDAFDCEGQGVVVIGNVPRKWFDEITPFFERGTTVELHCPDGTSCTAVVGGVQLFSIPFRTPQQRIVGILLESIESHALVPCGTELYAICNGG